MIILYAIIIIASKHLTLHLTAHPFLVVVMRSGCLNACKDSLIFSLNTSQDLSPEFTIQAGGRGGRIGL